MAYPDNIETYRTFTNLPGMHYDVLKTDIPFAEDLNKQNNSIVAIETELGVTPSGASATVVARLDAMDSVIAAIKSALMPVGSIYSNNSDATNPATLLGFGTWSAFGAGRVLVSKSATGTFSTNGSTGGFETHTLTATEMQHTNLSNRTSGIMAAGGNWGVQSDVTGVISAVTATAHNILQPYIVVYMWRRTA